MNPRIETLPEKKLIGLRLTLSLTHNKTRELWQSFMPRRREIHNALGSVLYSLQRYPADYFEPFSPDREFEKWAAVEVSDFSAVPEGMERLIVPAGLYAVFWHRGGPATASQTFQYIFGTWLPQSGYRLDDRPHFEVLGEKYRNDDPDSEEEIWVPVRRGVGRDSSMGNGQW